MRKYFHNPALIEAIRGSIRKWEWICWNLTNNESAKSARDGCPLCEYVGPTEPECRDPDCDICPLKQAGYSCNKTASLWRGVCYLLYYEGDSWDDRIPIAIRSDACFAMYEAVCSLLPEYDPIMDRVKEINELLKLLLPDGYEVIQ